MLRIYVSGVFDLFHYGHILFFKKCKKLGKNVHLIVGIHNDETTTLYKRKPIMTEKERYKSIFESNIADEIIQNAPLIETKEFYKKFKIDLTVHAHGIEYSEL